MKHLVHDLPVAVDFKKREQVGETKTGPIIEFNPHGGNRSDKVDTSDPCVELLRRTVLVIPVKEQLDGAGEQVGTDITKDCRVGMEGGFHVVSATGPGTIDVVLDDLGDRVIFAHFCWYITHGVQSLRSVGYMLVGDCLDMNHSAVSDEVGTGEVTRII